MAVLTSSLIPFKLTSIPDRYTPVYVADQTAVATTAGTGAAVRLNRLQSGSFSMGTNVIDVIEMGSTFHPGGIDDLGEVKWNLSWNAVGAGTLASLTGTALPTTPGATTTIGQTEINAAKVDFIRMVADSKGTIFGTLYCPDCIIDDYTVDAKEKGVVTEMGTGRGPAAVFFPGFIVPKVYVATSGDVSAGYLSVGSILGADEAIVQIFLPGQGTPPSYFQQNGSSYFLKIEKVPNADITQPVTRYFEHTVGKLQAATTISTQYVTPDTFAIDMVQVGQSVTIGIGTANVETLPILAVASTVATESGTGTVGAPGSATVTPVSMQGIVPKATLQVANSDGSNPETISVTSTTTSTFTATYASTKTAHFTIKSKAPSIQFAFTKTHSSADLISGALVASQNYSGNAAFNPTGNKLYLGDTLVAGDAYRLTIMTYNTNSFPLTVPQTTPDTTDRAGVTSRLIPLNINGLKTDRVQGATFKMALKRDHVQGIGENKIIYGISSVPDVSVDFDVKETDLSLLNQLERASKNLSSQGGSIKDDFRDLNYLTRAELATAVPASISLFDPFDASKVLCTWAVPQVVVRDIDYSSSNKADNTVKITGLDIQGKLTLTITNNN